MSCFKQPMAKLLRALRSPDRLLLAQAFAALLLADLGVRFFGILATWRVIQARYRRPGRLSPSREAERLRGAVLRAARHHLYPMRCLPQTLTLAWLLGRHGVAVQLRLGVRTTNGRLLAHAWLEADGRALGAAVDEAGPFQPLAQGDVIFRMGEHTNPRGVNCPNSGRLRRAHLSTL